MNDKFEVFLESLDKYEVAFLYRYRYNQYMKGTQDKIDRLLTKYDITEEKIDNLVKERVAEEYNNDLNKQCVRCKSYKQFSFLEEVNRTNSNSGIAFAPDAYNTELEKREKFECAVCGFDPHKDSLRGLGKIKSKDIKNGNRFFIWVGIIVVISIVLYFIFK